jgi:hypothetical protein
VGGYLEVDIHNPQEEEDEEEEEEGRAGMDYVTLTRVGEVSPHVFDDFTFITDGARDREIVLKVPFKRGPAYEVWYVSNEEEVLARFGPLDLRTPEELEGEGDSDAQSDEASSSGAESDGSM